MNMPDKVNDTVHGFNAQMHNYNNAKARGNKADMKSALTADSVELSDYEDSNTKKRAKNELNGKLRENGMKTIDKAIRMIDKNIRLEKLYNEAKKDYHNAMPILSDLKKEIKNKKDKIKSEKNGFKRKVLEQELSELNEYYSKIDSLV